LARIGAVECVIKRGPALGSRIDGNLGAIGDRPARTAEDRHGEEIGIHEIEPVGVPDKLPIDLVLVDGSGPEVMGPAAGADGSRARAHIPFGHVAGLRFADFIGQPVNLGGDILEAEGIPWPAQILVLVDPGLPEVLRGKQPVPRSGTVERQSRGLKSRLSVEPWVRS